MSGTTPPPPGWYADPAGEAAGERWWDGERWSGDVRPASGAPAGAAGGGPPPWSADGSDPPSGPAVRTIPMRAAWWALAGIAAGEIVGGLLASIAATATGDSTTAAVPTLAGEVGLWAGMLGSCLLVSRRYGTGSLQRDFTLGLRRRDLLAGPAAGVVGLVVTLLVSAAFTGTSLAGSNTQVLTGQKGNGIGYALVTLMVALGAPFFEELFFRGLIRTALSTGLGPTGAIFGQALLFGLAHYEAGNGLGNVSVMLAIGCFGVVLGYTARLTGRLGAGMIAHSLFNVVAAVSILTG